MLFLSLFAQHFHHKQKLLKNFSYQERLHCSLWFYLYTLYILSIPILYIHLIALLNTCIPTPFLPSQFSTLSVFVRQSKE